MSVFGSSLTGMNRLPTVAFTEKIDQNGLEESTYGANPFLQVERTQTEPPAGLGYIAATNNLFSATTGDGPVVGYEEDNWKPLWKEQWVKDKARLQMWDWNMANVHSAREDVFRHNQGRIFHNKGAPYLIPTDRPKALHKLRMPLF